jgi:transcriptional regulator with XRE-family HTH domain
MKSLRDGKDFSIYQLAKAINIPHSIIVKLLHSDPSKRVSNPRIDTLAKIVDFFKSDGFQVTIDDLILGNYEIDINSVSIKHTENIAVEIFSLDNIYKNIGKININLTTKSDGLIALLSDKKIDPFFKAGSVFIIDTTIPIKEDNLVAVRMEEKPIVQIKKLIINNKIKHLSDLIGSNLIKFSAVHHHILGVIIQVNVKT